MEQDAQDHPPTSPPPPRGKIPCASCGTPVIAATGTMCPTCHHALRGDSFDPEAEPFIVHDRLCLSCGYALEGLRSDRECPECGVPIARSLRGNLLRYSSPQYLRTLHTGIFLAELATCSIVIFAGIAIALHAMASQGWWSNWTAQFLSELLGLIPAGVALVGWWMFSDPDPSQVGRDTAIGARKLLRVSLLLEATLVVATFALSFILPATTGGADTTDLLSGVSMLVWLGRFVTSMFYMKSIAMRFPDGKLYSHAGRLVWLGPLVTVLLCGLGIIFAYVSYIVMLDRARVNMKNAREQAEKMPA